MNQFSIIDPRLPKPTATSENNNNHNSSLTTTDITTNDDIYHYPTHLTPPHLTRSFNPPAMDQIKSVIDGFIVRPLPLPLGARTLTN